jgi:hypothetical protein
MAKYYPGLHVVVAGLQQVTRVSTYRSGTVLILLFHVLSLWGVFELVRTLRPGSERAAGIAAVVYALSPTYSFFNAQLAYQTMAVPFVIWTFVFVALYLRTDAPSRTRAIHGTMAAGCGAIVAVTHHLSGLVVSALLLVALVALLAKRGARPTRRDLALLVGVALLPLLWAAAVRAPVVSYLRPYPERGWHELAQRVGVEDKPAAGIGQGNTVPRSDRQLFGGSELPGYERAAAFAAPVLALGFAALALRRRRWTPVDCVVVVLAAGYFLSLPLVYTATGAQGAHRSWAFSYVGLAVLMGLGIARFQAARSVPRWLASLVVSATLVTLLVGNYAAENNDRVRFPGPFTFLADGRGVTDELRGLAERFRAEEGDGKRVISDVLTGSVLASYGRATYLRDYPSWEVFYPTAPLDEEQHQALLRAGVYAVVVDRRLAVYERARAFYFSDSEPANPGVLPEASVAKFGSTRWLRARYRTANYEIYVVEGSS